jgi:ABC-type nitrate/sulfonate/bicarbonate transport system substrate-binding protein
MNQLSRRSVLRGSLAFTAAATLDRPFIANAAGDVPLTVMVFQGLQNLPLLAAHANGVFAKHGLSVDIRIAPGSEELRNGLAQGRYQIVHTAVDNAVAMAEVAKIDIAVVLGGDNGFNHLFVQPEIRSYQDLRGKTVVVDAPDTAFALQLYKMLKLNGLQKGDYAVKPLGGTIKRLEAMQQDKTAAAAILNAPFSIRAQRAGLKDMGTAVAAIGPYLATSGFVLREWGAANAEVLTRYIAAYLDGLRWALDPANKTQAVDLLAAWLKVTPDIALECYEIAANPTDGLTKDAQLDLDGFQNVLKLRAEIEGQWGGMPPLPGKYLDLTYYRRALEGL